MDIIKAVITAAGRNQRHLPIQTLMDRDGVEKSVLAILVEEALSAGIEDIAVVVAPGDARRYTEVVEQHAGRLHFITQHDPLGYGHAVYCARDFVGEQPFLHLVGDHLYVSYASASCAQQLVQVAKLEDCAVSAVQATRETLLPYYGTVGGRRVPGSKQTYIIERVVEKPTPTEAELSLIVPGLRAGHYLCFFGMHVLTPAVMDILAGMVRDATGAGEKRVNISLSAALADLALREKYLAWEGLAQRYDVGVKYGLLIAQMALALNGADRDFVLSRLLELLAGRVLSQPADVKED
ncbi:MAG: sugar phosphate nucleotidyltransferase [Anaerolineae bacterium]|nr:sugar phosphate nucleotidyltransferase [Anaerolineae bacterium]